MKKQNIPIRRCIGCMERKPQSTLIRIVKTQRINGEDTLRLHHLEKYVDALVCADDVTHHKPHPESFLTAAEKLGLNSKECLVFEDGKLGIEAAAAGGFDCVEVQRGEMVKFYQSK